MQSTAEYSEPSGSSFFSSYCSLHPFPTHFHDSGHSHNHTYFHNCNRNNIFLFLHQPYSAQLQAYVFHSFPTARLLSALHGILQIHSQSAELLHHTPCQQ